MRDLANAHIAELAPYIIITAADLTALEDARAAFQAAITAPRCAAVDRRAHTESLPEMIAKIRGIFRNELDKMIIAFRASNPAFYNGYFAARTIVDRMATHATPEISTPPTPASPT